jgi:hypothetical protein
MGLFKFSAKRLKGEILAPPIFNSGSWLVTGFATAGNASCFGYAQQPLACGYEN